MKYMPEWHKLRFVFILSYLYKKVKYWKIGMQRKIKTSRKLEVFIYLAKVFADHISGVWHQV